MNKNILRYNIFLGIIKIILAIIFICLIFTIKSDFMHINKFTEFLIKIIFPIVLISMIIYIILSIIYNKIIIDEKSITIKKIFTANIVLKYDDINFFHWLEYRQKFLFLIPINKRYFLKIVKKDNNYIKLDSKSYYDFYNKIKELENNLINQGIIINGASQSETHNFFPFIH